jgi:3-methyladenine DNA glycosylase AlkD
VGAVNRLKPECDLTKQNKCAKLVLARDGGTDPMGDRCRTAIRLALQGLPAQPDCIPSLVSLIEQALAAGASDHDLVSTRGSVAGRITRYTVPLPELRFAARHLIRHYRDRRDALTNLAQALWSREYREVRLLAVELVGALDLLPEEAWAQGVQWLDDSADRELCDALCGYLLGPALCQHPAHFADLEEWAHSASPWHRRASLMATMMLRHFSGPPQEASVLDQRTRQLCSLLLIDDDPAVRQAVEWAIGEVGWRDPGMTSTWIVDQLQRTDLPRPGRALLLRGVTLPCVLRKTP